jgi:hypothetical protein
MASYPTILPPPNNPGFLQGLGQGISSGANAYSSAATGDYFEQLKEKRRMEKEQSQLKLQEEEKQKEFNAFQQSMMESNLPMSQASYGAQGPSYTFKQPGEEAYPKYDSMIRSAVAGNIPYEDVSKGYPTKYQQVMDIEKQQMPVGMDPGFKEGTGGMISQLGSYFSGSQAELTPQTKTVIDNIKNRLDLDEFIANEQAYSEAGVDVKAIKEYFGIK